MKSYVGTATGTSSAHTVEVHEDGQLVGLLTHHVKHSPTGFSWGYGGSGAADLARCILIDHYGPRAWCPGCDSSGQQVWDPSTESFVPHRTGDPVPDDVAETVGACAECMGALTADGPGLYQEFKRYRIAGLPQEGRWEITATEIDAWLASHPTRENRP